MTNEQLLDLIETGLKSLLRMIQSRHNKKTSHVQGGGTGEP